MIYLDSSALVKLVLPEAETPALRKLLASRAEPKMTSALARVEVIRAVRHAGPHVVAKTREMLDYVARIPLRNEVLDDAASLGDTVLRSLDAIHLASAIALGQGLTSFIAYDKRLLRAAVDQGLPVDSP